MIQSQPQHEATAANGPVCSIAHCPLAAAHSEAAVLGQWLITAYFCGEHQRELDEGMPLGGLTLDQERLRVEPLDSDLPAATDSTHSISPQ